MGPSLKPQNRTGKSEGRLSAFTLSGPALGVKNGPYFGTVFGCRRNVTVASTQAYTNNFVPQRRIFYYFNSSNADGIDRGMNGAKSPTQHTHTGLIPSHGRLPIYRTPPSALPAQLAPLLLHLVSLKLSPKR